MLFTLGAGVKTKTAGNKVYANMNAKITPVAEYNPKSQIGSMLAVNSVRNPIAVVIEVRRVASPISLKAILSAGIFQFLV